MSVPEGLKTELYVTGTGQHLEVHERKPQCLTDGCLIHNPSDHHMCEWPTHWREDRNLMERICPHGVGHPDPDGLKFIARTGAKRAVVEGRAIHGCDGCCTEPPA